MKITLCVVGKLKPSPMFDLCQEYLKRMQWSVSIREIPHAKTSTPAQEAVLISKEITPGAFIVALDERGDSFGSQQLASKMMNWYQQSSSHGIVFIIGGADGLDDSIRKKANVLMSFGKQTWPHMLVRVMLLEQIYRAQQINAGHPYHRQ